MTTAKQTEMKGKGLERPNKIQAIEDAADELKDHRDKRMSHLEKELEMQEKLVELFHKHKISVYKYDGRIVTLKDIEKISVKSDKDNDAKAKD